MTSEPGATGPDSDAARSPEAGPPAGGPAPGTPPPETPTRATAPSAAPDGPAVAPPPEGQPGARPPDSRAAGRLTPDARSATPPAAPREAAAPAGPPVPTHAATRAASPAHGTEAPGAPAGASAPASAPPGAGWGEEPRPGSITAVFRAPFLRPLLGLPLKKVSIWAAFLGLLWVLRDFKGLIVLTFVVSYITTRAVGHLERHFAFSSRRVPVLLVFGLIVGTIAALGAATIPRALRQGREQLRRLEDFRTADPLRVVEVRLGQGAGRRPEVEGVGMVQGGQLGAFVSQARHRSERAGVAGELFDRLSEPAVRESVAESLKWVRDAWVAPGLKGALAGVWGGLVTVFLALVFSFMIVWDAPRLAAGVARLRDSRLGDVWVEVAPSIATFARLLGRALEAQTMIAFVNTTLTVVGMLLLGIPGIGLLSVVVFVCSFIPIVGVFVSTVPICLVALQLEGGGLGLAVAVVVMVTLVHMLEAYVLNPRIYGAHMKLHPVAVLLVLYVGEHTLGVWGLVLGVPIATYAWRHLVLGEHEALEEAPPPAVVLGR